jgi:hypothetical protein
VSCLLLALKKETYSALADMWALALDKYSGMHSLFPNMCNSVKKALHFLKKLFFLHIFLSCKSSVTEHTYYSDILVLNLFNIFIFGLSFKTLLEIIISSPFTDVLFLCLTYPKTAEIRLKMRCMWCQNIYYILIHEGSMVYDWILN